MSHDHHHHTKGLTLAFWLNAGFTVIELVGGLYANSTAILTDAVHDFGDTIAIGSGVWLEKVSQKGRNHTYSYGYKRFSLLSAVILSVFLLVGASFMLAKSIADFFAVKEVHSETMIGLAILGVVVNGIGFWRIYRAEKGHGHNTRVIMLHLLEDVLGWIAVLIGGTVIYFTQWYWIDPLLSCAIALFIIWRALPNLLKTVKIFLQAVPESIPLESLRSDLMEIEKVRAIHDLHAWTMDGNDHVVSVHLVVDTERLSDTEEIRRKVKTLFGQYRVDHVTVQFERHDHRCDRVSE